MLPASATLAKQFDEVMHAAAAVGLRDTSTRIARRASGLDQPFMLFVMGERGSGKSAVINRLASAEVAPVDGAPETWLNVYRRRTGRFEYAELFWKSTPGKPDVLPLEQARSFTRGGAAFEATMTADLDRVVWHVDATGLHRDLALVEVPDSPDALDDAAWEADAILWLRSAAGESPEPTAALTRFRRERSPFVPALCVVTHMERVPHAEWLSRLRTIRNGFGSAFDHVVPFGLERDGKGRIIGAVTAPLRRSVLTWFTGGAEETRRKNHQHFIDVMRRLVSRRLEHEIDVLLQSGRDFMTFERELPARVTADVDSLRAEIDRYLVLLRESLVAFGERLEHSALPFQIEPFVPPIAPHVLFARLTEDLTKLAAEHGLRWRPSGEDSSTGEAAAPRLVSHPPIPHAPTRFIEHLWTTRGASTPTEVEAVGPGSLDSTRSVVEAMLFVPSHAAAGRIVEEARAAIEYWLEEASRVVTSTAARTARALFQDRFGCAPEAAGERMTTLEEHFFRIQGFVVSVPAPHLQAEELSPAQLLWRAGDPDFVSRWNEDIVQAFVGRALPDVGRRIQKEIALHLDAQEDEWERCRIELSTWLENRVAHDDAANLNSSGRGASDVDEALHLLPLHLRQPLQQPSSGLILEDEAAELLSLLLAPHASFLLPRHAFAPGSPGRAAVRIVQNTVRDEAARLWNEKVESAHESEDRGAVRQRILGSALFAITFATAWLILLGGGWLSIGSLVMMSGLGATLQWRRVIWDARERVRARLERQVEEIWHRVPLVLDARAEHLRRFTGVLVRDAGFQRAVQAELLKRMHATSPALPSYAELVRRLRQSPELAVAA